MKPAKLQQIGFGLIMSYAMAFGMEVYNVAIQQNVHVAAGGFSSLTYGVLRDALLEGLCMGLIVFVISNLWGNRLGARFAARHCDPTCDNAYLCRLFRQGGTVAVMCPSMSLIASLLFSVWMGGAPWTHLPVIWVGTVLKNFPMAFFWNFFAAAPFTHWICSHLFSHGESS